MLASTPIIRAYIELYFFLLWRHCSFWCKELLTSHSFSFSTFSLPSTYLSLISMLNICKMCSSLAVWRLVKLLTSHLEFLIQVKKGSLGVQWSSQVLPVEFQRLSHLYISIQNHYISSCLIILQVHYLLIRCR